MCHSITLQHSLFTWPDTQFVLLKQHTANNVIFVLKKKKQL